MWLCDVTFLPEFALNAFYLISARRRLSRSLSSERDVEVMDRPCINVESPSECTSNDSGDSYAVGKPLEVCRHVRKDFLIRHCK